MANDRNISALVQVLRGAPGLPAGIPLEELARHLAAAGVLYAAALTDDQAVKIGADAVGSIPPIRPRSPCAFGKDSSVSPEVNGSSGRWSGGHPVVPSTIEKIPSTD